MRAGRRPDWSESLIPNAYIGHWRKGVCGQFSGDSFILNVILDMVSRRGKKRCNSPTNKFMATGSHTGSLSSNVDPGK